MIADELVALRPIARLANAWDRVRSGLKAMRSATIIVIATVPSVLLLLAVVTHRTIVGKPDHNTAALLASIVGLGIMSVLLAAFLFMVGQCRCCAPRESRAKRPALFSVICHFSSLVLTLLGCTFMFDSSDGSLIENEIPLVAASFFVTGADTMDHFPCSGRHVRSRNCPSLRK